MRHRAAAVRESRRASRCRLNWAIDRPGEPDPVAAPVSSAQLLALIDESTLVAGFAAYATGTSHLNDGDRVERLTAVRADLHLFALLGSTAMAGRTFDRSDPPDVAVISEDLWRRRFGGSSISVRAFNSTAAQTIVGGCRTPSSFHGTSATMAGAPRSRTTSDGARSDPFADVADRPEAGTVQRHRAAGSVCAGGGRAELRRDLVAIRGPSGRAAAQPLRRARRLAAGTRARTHQPIAVAAVRGRGPRAGGRVRECCEPAAGAVGGAVARSRDARRPRRHAGAPGAAVSCGKRDAGDRRCGGRHRRRVVGYRSVCRPRRAEDSARARDRADWRAFAFLLGACPGTALRRRAGDDGGDRRARRR